MTINPNATVTLAQHAQIRNEATVTINSGILNLGNYTEDIRHVVLNNGVITGNPGSIFYPFGTGVGITSSGTSEINTTTVPFANEVVVSDGTLTINGSVAYDPRVTIGIVKSGAGTLRLNATNSYAGGTTINAGKLAVNGSILGTVTVNAGGTLGGNGTINGGVAGDGRVAPGNSPGILTINGDFTQNANSSLEIEVGGLTPGTQHDQVRVGGVATLGGVYEFPIINGFVPQAGDEITFIETFDVDGPGGPTPPGSIAIGTLPRDATAPGLDTANPDLAFRVVSTPGIGGNVKLEFVSETEIFFDGSAATPNWFVAGAQTNWDLNRDPIDSDRTTVENVTGIPQMVVINSNDPDTGAKPEVNQLVVGEINGSAIGPVTVTVESGFELKARTGDVTIGDQGTIELDAASLSAPSSQKVDVMSGGLLAGNGTIKAGDLLVSGGTLRPGFSVGHLDVQGNYQQEADGTLLMDLVGTQAGEFDTVDITGTVTLGGTLEIDASSLATTNPGQPFEIISAGSLIGTFDSVDHTGNDAIYFKTLYDYSGGGGSVSLAWEFRGDMDDDGVVEIGQDSDDFELFVFGLMNRSTTKYFARCNQISDGNCEIAADTGGDFNGNGRLDFDDIAGFQNQLAGMGMSSDGLESTFERYLSNVPEPSSGLLAVLGNLIAGLARGSRRRCRGGHRMLNVNSITSPGRRAFSPISM